jgi:hypothetical protein
MADSILGRLSLPWLALALIVTGCCTTPKSVLDLSKQAKDEAEFLAKQQEGSLDAFTKFTKAVESKIVSPLVATNATLVAKIGKTQIAGLDAAIDLREARLNAQFESNVTALRIAFEAKLESDFIEPLNPGIKLAEAEARKAQDEAKTHGGDPAAQAYSRNRLVRLEELQFRGALAEIELRKSFDKAVSGLRTQIAGQISSAMNGLREQVAGRSKGQVADAVAQIKLASTNTTVSFSKQRETVATFRAQVAALGQAHKDALAAMDAYLTRPSEVKLFVSGAFGEAKDKLHSLSSKLGPLAGVADGVTDSFFNAAETEIGTKSDSLGTLISGQADSLRTTLLAQIKASTAAILASDKTTK